MLSNLKFQIGPEFAIIFSCAKGNQGGIERKSIISKVLKVIRQLAFVDLQEC